MIILKPTAATRHKVNPYTTYLHFDTGLVRPFYVRGAIAFPDGNNEGFGIMAGQDLNTKSVIIFEEFRFWTIEAWLNGDGMIHKRDDGTGFDLGLMQFITDMHSRYKATTYYWGGQHIDVRMRYCTQIYRSQFIHPDFSLIEIPFVSEIGDRLLSEKLSIESFKGQVDGYVSKAVNQFVNANMDAGAKTGAVLAIETLLAGFEKIPWVDIKES